jgi:two-component system, cell cycle response regulator PopA
MSKPQILVLAGSDAASAMLSAGFSLAGDDNVRRQTAAIVVEARGEAGAKAADLVRSLRAALGPRAGLFFAWADPASVYDTSVFDGALDSQANSLALAARINSSLRIAVMADEARLRFASLEKFGGAPKPPKLVTPKLPRILVFGQPSPDMLRYCSILETNGASTISCFTSFTAFDYLHDGDFDGVALLANDDVAGTLGFCGALRRNARLFHLPCQILGSPDFAEPGEALSRGASDFAIIGDDDDAAATRLLDFVDEKRSRDAISLAFAAARAPKAMDPGTGLYDKAFFSHHLERLVGRAHETDRPLSVAIIRIAPDEMTRELEKGRGLDRIVGQAGAMLARLVRAEDVAARLDRTTFGVAFPASEALAAKAAAIRTCSVLEWTTFDIGRNTGKADGVVPSNDTSIQIKLLNASVQLRQNESAADFLTRSITMLAGDIF